MTKLNSVFRDEIKMHLSVREAELSHEAYRHYRRTMVLFDNYLCRIHHTDKEIPESVIESWIKEVSVGISLNTSSQHVHYVRQLLLFLVNSGYKCFIPRTLITHGLGEAGVALRNLLALIDPGGFPVILGDGDLAGAGAGADHRGKPAEDVVLLKGLHQAALKLIRHGVAAFRILADGQGVVDLAVVPAGADHVPEGIPVLIRRGRPGILIFRGTSPGRTMDRGGSRGGKLGVQLGLLLQTLDLRAQVLDLLGHLVVLLHGFRGHKAVLAAVLLQERFGLLPEGVALAGSSRK